MKKYTVALMAILTFAFQIQAQNVAINNDGSQPHPNAILDIKGTNKGLLIPRGDAATRTTLNTNTAKGLMMYDTVDNTLWMHNGNGSATGWSSMAVGTNYWQSSGAGAIQNTNAGGLASANATTLTVDPGILVPPINTAGTRFMWFPQKSALRAGTVTGFQWSSGVIGSWSTAFGFNTQASGAYSTALGYQMNTHGERSIGIGSWGDAVGPESIAIGYDATTFGDRSVGFGTSVYAEGIQSMALGQYSRSSGYNSTSAGFNNLASGDYSHAFGTGNVARAYSSFTVGRYNDSVASSAKTFLSPSNPLLYIGNGTSDGSRHNAGVVYANGDFIMKNPTTVSTNPAAYNVPITGGGTRMMWLPEKGAFRAGTVNGTDWNTANIGIHSFATGIDNMASGESSTAIGFSTSASGIYSFSSGSQTSASGGTSVAMGVLTVASGPNSTAFGRGTTASGTYSTAMGSGSTAFGSISTATGISNEANGYASLVGGVNNFANGDYSVVMGSNNTGNSHSSVYIGRYSLNLGGSGSTWVSTDPLLVLGNGTADISRSNALVVYKNGNTDVSGYTQLGTIAESAPAIKMKKLTGTSAAIDGGDLAIPHGLTRSKIIGVQVLLQYSSTGGGGDVLPGYTESNGFEYSVSVTSTSINIFLVPGNCASILNKPVRVLVTYEE